MADRGLGMDQDAFCCSICLDLLKEPATIPCGHSYCMSCINSHWNEELTKQNYSCPQCRQKFSQRPMLVKNTMLNLLMEGLKKTVPTTAPDDKVNSCGTEGDDVGCDLCTGKKQKAVKSCLQCLVSYCKDHLQPHYDVPALKKHKLVEPTLNLQDHICSRHDEVMKMFCRTDQQCICYLCSVDEHKGHDTVTAAAERAVKQKELEVFQQNIERIRKTTSDNADTLHWELKCIGLAADAVEVKIDKTHKKLISHIEKKMAEVKQQIRAQVEAEERRLKDLEHKLQHQDEELLEKSAELENLANTEDHCQFLHNFSKLCKICEEPESIKMALLRHVLPIAVPAMMQAKINEICTLDLSPKDETPTKHMAFKAVSRPTVDLPHKGETPTKQTAAKTVSRPTVDLPHKGETPTKQKAAKTVSRPTVDLPHKGETPTKQMAAKTVSRPVLPPVPRVNMYSPLLNSAEDWPALPSRSNLKPTASTSQSAVKLVSAQPPKMTAAELGRYSRDLTLDPRSLNNNLELSRENSVVKCMPYTQSYQPHPFRFTDFPQVVSKWSLTGRCFWKVSMKMEKCFTVAVAYKDMKRDGPSNECCFGKNAKSWALECFKDRCVFWHNGHSAEIPVTSCNRVGVFLDYKAGMLSFYEMYGLQHIFTVRTSFTQPLVAGLRLDDVGSVGGFGVHWFY